MVVTFDRSDICGIVGAVGQSAHVHDVACGKGGGAVFAQFDLPLGLIATCIPGNLDGILRCHIDIYIFRLFQLHFIVRCLFNGEIGDDWGWLVSIGFLIMHYIVPKEDNVGVFPFRRVGNLHAHMSVMLADAIFALKLSAIKIVAKIKWGGLAIIGGA